MKNVLKNIVKSIASVCLILEIVATVYLGIYNFAVNKAIANNNNELVQNVTEYGKSVKNNFFNSESEEENNKQIGILATFVPMYARFESIAMILMASIIIGSIIGIAKSIDENSRKKVVITYVLMYFVILALIGLYEILTYGKVDFGNLFGIAIETLVVYTVVFVLTVLKKKIDNNKKVKIMNKELQ